MQSGGESPGASEQSGGGASETLNEYVVISPLGVVTVNNEVLLLGVSSALIINVNGYGPGLEVQGITLEDDPSISPFWESRVTVVPAGIG